MRLNEFLEKVNEEAEKVLFLDEKGKIVGTSEKLWDRYPYSEVVKGFKEAKKRGRETFELEVKEDQILEFKIRRILGEAYLVEIEDVTCRRNLQKIKKEVISTISHEIRTPLTIIKGNTEFLLLYGSQDEESKKNLKEIYEKAEKIEEIVKGIGNLLVKRGIWEEVNLKEIAEPILKFFKREGEKKGIKVNYYLEEVKVECEKILFEQLIRNLVDNAVKFTKKGKVEVTLKKEKEKAVLTVKDTGIGIPKEIIDSVFEKYVKSPTSQGQGIGLAVVKEIAKFHNWEIKLKSKEGEGTEVKVFIK